MKLSVNRTVIFQNQTFGLFKQTAVVVHNPVYRKRRILFIIFQKFRNFFVSVDNHKLVCINNHQPLRFIAQTAQRIVISRHLFCLSGTIDYLHNSRRDKIGQNLSEIVFAFIVVKVKFLNAVQIIETDPFSDIRRLILNNRGQRQICRFFNTRQPQLRRPKLQPVRKPGPVLLPNALVQLARVGKISFPPAFSLIMNQRADSGLVDLRISIEIKFMIKLHGRAKPFLPTFLQIVSGRRQTAAGRFGIISEIPFFPEIS